MPSTTRLPIAAAVLTALAILPGGGKAADLSGDARLSQATGWEQEIEMFASDLGNGVWNCELQLTYFQNISDTEQAILGGDGGFRYAAWGEIGAADPNETGTLTVQYQEGAVEGGGYRRKNQVFVYVFGPFNSGQSFSFGPDSNDPGQAASNLTFTVYDSDIQPTATIWNPDDWRAHCLR